MRDGEPSVPSFPFALAAIDVDATLLGPDGLIGLENRRAVGLLRDMGCRVMLASGRRHANMLPLYEDLGLDEFVVSCQGARVEHSSSGLVLRRACLSPEETFALVAEGMERGHTVLLWLADGVYSQAETRWVDTYRRETGDSPVTITDLSPLARTPAEKVVWVAAPSEIAGAVAEATARWGGRMTVMVTNDWYLEFTASAATKASGVASVAFVLGIPRERVLAFGDGNNDVPLLGWAGLGVAMPHGRPAACRAAGLVGPGGDPESALARAVDSVVQCYMSRQAIPPA
jgi:Cof subfamily protein (haloacid dehalogenase superfamily)